MRFGVLGSGFGVQGFTLIESMLAAAILTVSLVALVGAFIGESFLVAHAQTLQVAMSDANRVMETIRQQNEDCELPSARPPDAHLSWDEWLRKQEPPMALGAAFEAIAVTCQDENGGAMPSDFCGQNQAGSGEWRVGTADTAMNPLRVTVAVGYRIQNRLISGTASGTASGPEFSYRGPRQTGAWVELVVHTCERVGGESPQSAACEEGGLGLECICIDDRLSAADGSPAGFMMRPGSTVRSVGPGSGRDITPGPDRNNNGVIESPAMLTTVLTCR